MDSNQCGGSNPVKDFSRLTLEDRSLQQNLRAPARTSRGGYQGSFRSRGANAPQSYDGFDGASSNLAALPGLDPSQPSFHPMGANAQGLGVGPQFGQPVPWAESFQQNAQDTSTRHHVQPSFGNPGPGEVGRTGALTHEQRFAPSAAQNSAQASRFPGFGAHGPPAGQVIGNGGGIGPRVGPQFHPGGFPMGNAPAFSRYPPRDALLPGQRQAPMAFARAHEQSQQAAAQQQAQFDREFQDAMDEWMSQHSDVADRSQARGQHDTEAAGRLRSPSQQEEMELAAQGAAFDAMAAEDHFEAAFRPAADSMGHEMTSALVADSPSLVAETVVAAGDDAPQTQDDRSKLALAAQNVIDAVADNDSAKFKNSKFLQMMRGLAEEQIVLEGRDFVRREQPAAGAGPSGSVSSTQSQDSRVVGNPNPAEAGEAARSRAPAASPSGSSEDNGKGKGKAVSEGSFDFDSAFGM